MWVSECGSVRTAPCARTAPLVYECTGIAWFGVNRYIDNLGRQALQEWANKELTYNVYDAFLGAWLDHSAAPAHSPHPVTPADFMHPIGRGFDTRTMHVRAPVFEMDFTDEQLKWQGHRIPKQATFSVLAEGAPVRSGSRA